MSWKGVTIMDQRIRFISEYLDNYYEFDYKKINFYHGERSQ